MKQCIRINFTLEKIPKNFLTIIQENAHKHKLEGTGQIVDTTTLKIAACGDPHGIEVFVDFIHQITVDMVAGAIEIEPFVRQRDYRGVFRIIE